MSASHAVSVTTEAAHARAASTTKSRAARFILEICWCEFNKLVCGPFNEHDRTLNASASCCAMVVRSLHCG